MSTPTVAFMNENLKWGAFEDKHVGDPFSWEGRVKDKKEWEKIVKRDEEEGQFKLYHALKY